VTRFHHPGHLPKRRTDEVDPYGELPRQRRGITPQMHGRYPDYDVLEQVDHWDELTREVVLARLDLHGPLRFFDEAEAVTLSAFCDVAMAQDGEPRIPLLAMVDEKLAAGRLDGFQYAGMPDDRETWRLVAKGLDEAAAAAGVHGGYAQAPAELQSRICDDLSKGRIAGATWESLDAARAFSVVMRAVLSEFYSHPWAWNEIGFGGPAYPRGYMRLGVGQSEAWEGREAVDTDPVPDVKRKGFER
jgi:Gluconate 2-dehydrogenase subunit 3